MRNSIYSSSLIFFSMCLGHTVYGQQLLNDPSIVSQHKRMVYESWGDFNPKAKRVLGVPTNIAYIMVWGDLAPSRNRRYKRGMDIRPLKPTGLESQRLALVKQQTEDTERLNENVDSLFQKTFMEYQYWSAAEVDADPLWLLYYRKMLSPLKRFSSEPKNYKDWGLKNPAQFEILNGSGGIRVLQEKLDLLKDQYKQARTVNMPRGKRLLLYHDILMGWRSFEKKRRQLMNMGRFTIEHREWLNQATERILKPRSDIEIMREIMDTHKNQF